MHVCVYATASSPLLQPRSAARAQYCTHYTPADALHTLQSMHSTPKPPWPAAGGAVQRGAAAALLLPPGDEAVTVGEAPRPVLEADTCQGGLSMAGYV
jgi:hypothetical protein